jgi:hypothetical protein
LAAPILFSPLNLTVQPDHLGWTGCSKPIGSPSPRTVCCRLGGKLRIKIMVVAADQRRHPWTPRSCYSLQGHTVRQQLHVLAYDLATTLALLRGGRTVVTGRRPAWNSHFSALRNVVTRSRGPFCPRVSLQHWHADYEIPPEAGLAVNPECRAVVIAPSLPAAIKDMRAAASRRSSNLSDW